MKRVRNWLAKKTKRDFFIAVAILLVIDILVRSWFCSELHLKFDSTIFNNIVTPIATLVAIFIAAAAYKYQLGQNILPHIEREFERVSKVVKAENPEGLQTKYSNVSTKDFIKNLSKIHIQLLLDPNREYVDDFNDSKNGKFHSALYYKGRSYFEEINYLNYFAVIGLNELYSVVNLIGLIRDSVLSQRDKEYFYRRVYLELVKDYVDYIMSRNSPNVVEFMIPILNGELNIKFQSLLSEAFTRPYDLMLPCLAPFIKKGTLEEPL